MKSKYQRKTADEYTIQGNYGYGHGWEDVAAEETRKEGLARLKEYRANDSGNLYRMIKRRVRLGIAA